MYKAGKKQGIDLGQVINRLLKIADFGHNLGKGFGKRAAHHHPIFLRVPPPRKYGKLICSWTILSHEIQTFYNVNKYLMFLNHFCKKKKKQAKLLVLSKNSLARFLRNGCLT